MLRKIERKRGQATFLFATEKNFKKVACPLFTLKVACPLFTVLLILAFPNFQISFLAWIALVPLFFILDNSSKLKSLILSYVAGLIFFGGTLYWLTYVTKLGYAILIFYSALFFALFGLFGNIFLNKLRSSKLNFLSFLILPSLWVSLEFIRGALFTGFPWAILGYTQYKNPILIQIADITGSYGVSFIIVMVNFVLYRYLVLFRRTSNSRMISREDFHTLRFQTAVTILTLAVTLLYGHYLLKGDDIISGLKISVVQGNIPQEKKWDPIYKDFILERYEELTLEAARDESDLIIWPETSVPGYLDEEDISLWLKSLVNETGIPLFLGIVTYKFGQGRNYFFNSASLFSTKGLIEREYFKLHLVPLGEYVPFEKYFPFVRDFINKPIGDFSAGDEYTLFHISKGNAHLRYAALICFEDIFPYLSRRFTLEGADFLINMTNDAWFGESSEHLQHTQASVFRAVENRVSVVRAANTGYSCYINPKGIIEDSIYDEDRGSMYIAGFKTFEIKISEKETFYTQFGDVFTYLCILLVLGTVLAVKGLTAPPLY